MPLSSGTHLGPYEILAPLGKGGMGEVYRARDSRLGRLAAIKVLPAHLTADRSRRDRFVREAQAASALNHPNIVTIYEIGEVEGGLFIAMELVAGRTLREVAREPVSTQLLIQLAEQIARALAVAHAAGIIHRDLKPENIMWRDDGYAKVLDFGLACLAASRIAQSVAETRTTLAGVAVGTPMYMSPEQILGELVDTPTDIFSFGIVLYELGAGQHPFVTDHNFAGRATVSHPPLSLSHLNPEVPPVVEGLIFQMLRKEPGRRPTAAELEGALADLTVRRTSARPRSEVSKPKRHTVGREKERAELRDALGGVLAGRGFLVCVAGEPGVGKTTLIEEFLEEMSREEQDFGIARGRCSERLAAAEAYLPVLEVLESLLHAESGDWIARVMKLIAPTWYGHVVPLSGVGVGAHPLEDIKTSSPERMKRELSALLQEIARARPLIVFLDDLQWADLSTVDLLAYLAARFDSLPVLILAGYRTSDMMVAKHPFLPVKLDLQGRDLCREISLKFLTLSDVERYLALHYPGHRFPTELPSLIHNKTEGSPLFMVNLLRYLGEQGFITEQPGSWTLTCSVPEIGRELPESLRSMIQRNCDQLSDSDRQLLMAASVQGYEFDSATITEVLGREAADVEERLEVLDRVHSFVKVIGQQEYPDGSMTLRCRFVHVLYQNALYAALAPTRRASWSGMVAQGLIRHYGEQCEGIACEVALLLEAARDFPRAADYFLLATQNAFRKSAHEEAVLLARRGLELLGPVPDSKQRSRQEIMLQMALGRSLMMSRGLGSAEVEEPYFRARELCQRLDDKFQLGRALGGIWYFHFARAELDTAVNLARELLRLAECEADPALLIEGDLALGITQSHRGELGPGQYHLERAISLVTSHQHDPSTFMSPFHPNVEARCHLAITLWLLGYPDQALVRARESLTLAQKFDHPQDICMGLCAVIFCHALRHEVESTVTSAKRLILFAGEHGLPQALFWGTFFQGWALTEQNHYAEGIAEMREGLDRLTEMGQHLTLMCMPFYARALGKSEHKDEALRILHEGLGAAKRGGARLFEAEMQRLETELLLTGSLTESEAEARLHQAIAIARLQGAKSLQLRAAMSLFRCCQKQQGRELQQVYNWFTEGLNTGDLREAKALIAKQEWHRPSSL